MAVTFDAADGHWLVGLEAARWLDEVSGTRRPLHSVTSALRKELSPERAHLVLEQVELRRRAQTKFRAAQRMFLTRIGLEQATDQYVAAYKARRIPQGQWVADLCAGIGGDLMGLAGRGPVVGVDHDPFVAILAEANLHLAGSEQTTTPPGTHGVRVQVQDAALTEVGEFAAWHVDPDRRVTGRRVRRVERHEPAPEIMLKLLEQNPNAAIKLAPAAALPGGWPPRSEREWISRDRQCRQLVAWFGNLTPAPGRRRATVVDTASGAVQTVHSDTEMRPPVVARVGRYLFEPDPAVLAAGLDGTLAVQHAMAAVAPDVAYLTGDRPIQNPLLTCFEVTDVLPFQVRRIKQLLRERQFGRLEVKKRGVSHDPERLRKQLRVPGNHAATLLVTRINKTVTAILARRLH